ncbi:MAG: hypothetical protein M1820_007934 [Bogoriella megaspora]|nr:MAG: hypothetical protein M1820_007934 [Bogoriella megaspora]
MAEPRPGNPGEAILNSTGGYDVVQGPRYMLFSISQDVSVELIEELIRISHEYESHYNCWSLIQSPTQTPPFDNPTHLPIPTTFRTGFTNYSIPDLGAFLSSHESSLPTSLKDPNQEPFSTEVFGVLDARSAQDKTMWLVVRDFIAPGEQSDDDDELLEEPIWRPLRFRLEDGASEAGALEVGPAPWYQEQDEKGVDAVLDGSGYGKRPKEVLEKLSPP